MHSLRYLSWLHKRDNQNKKINFRDENSIEANSKIKINAKAKVNDFSTNETIDIKIDSIEANKKVVDIECFFIDLDFCFFCFSNAKINSIEINE